MYLSALSGLLLALSFPKFSLGWLAWVALVPFLLALKRASGTREALWCGGIFSLIFFGFDLFWLTSLTRFVGGWALLGWLCLTIFQTIFILLFVYLARVVKFSIWLTPILWVAIEWLRSIGPFGITAGGLGYSQAAYLPLIQIASVTSVYGVSFLIILFNLALIKRRTPLVLVVLLLLAVILYGNNALRQERRPGPELKVAVIQPNVDQFDRMRPDKVPEIFALHEALTRQAKGADVIIWPETAIFTYLLQDQNYFAKMRMLAKETNAWLVFGTPYYDGSRGYNSIAVLSPSGEVTSRYDKQRLVPFGEYLPFRWLLYPFLKTTGYFDGDFSVSRKISPLVIKGVPVGAAVCFESTFTGTMRERAKGAQFLLTVTNDGWFGNSAAADQHLAAGAFRAVENRQYFIQAANTGLSALIDPNGRVLIRSQLNKREILTFEVPLR